MIELVIEEYQLLMQIARANEIEIIYFSVELPNGEKLVIE